jgi:hypothetical protein
MFSAFAVAKLSETPQTWQGPLFVAFLRAVGTFFGESDG